jgi:hypothetical protein
VELDLPYPLIPAELEFWAGAAHIKSPFGTIPVTLDCTTKCSGPRIEWAPSVQASLVIRNCLTTLAKAPWVRRRLLVRLTLKGNFVYAAGNPDVNVDGEVFGALEGSVLDVKLPRSGDGRRGGDLEMWVWLVPDAAVNGVVVGVLASAAILKTPQLQQAAAQVFALAVDRAKLRSLVPADFGIDETATPDLVQARTVAAAAGLQQHPFRVVVDDRLAGAADLFPQQLGQIGVKVEMAPMPADAIVEQGAALGTQGFDVVVAGQDAVDRAVAASTDLLAGDAVVQL